MNLQQFTEKYRVRLSKKTSIACKEGITRMANGKDTLHIKEHIFGLLDLLDNFFNESNQIKFEQIDFNVLLPAICWHDTWKATQNPKSKWALLFGLIYEGQGSCKIFKKWALSNNFSSENIKSICRAIKLHNTLGLQLFIKHKSLESKILWDLDWVYSYTSPVYETLLKNYERTQSDYAKLSLDRYKKHVQSIEDRKVYFHWSKNRIKLERKKFQRFMDEGK